MTNIHERNIDGKTKLVPVLLFTNWTQPVTTDATLDTH